MTGQEFVRRFACHILPPYCQRIRYVGLFGPRIRKRQLAICHDVLESTRGMTKPHEQPSAPAEPAATESEEAIVPEPKAYAPECRRCGMPGMQSQGVRSYQRTIAYLTVLQGFYFDCVYSRLSTFDIDRSTRTSPTESLDCVPRIDEVIVMAIANRSAAYTIPVPDT